MSGSARRGRILLRELRRNRITFILGFCFSLVIGIIGYAVYDFSSELRQKEQLAKTASLKTELTQFVLGLREDDGFPLLDNAEIVGRETRPLKFLRWNRPLFTYFLHQGNARTFNILNLKWDPPPSCVVEFGKKENPRDAPSPTGESRMSVCLTVVPNDVTGRYLYFSLQYPDHDIVRHVVGQDLKVSDKVVLTLVGDRAAKFELVMDEPKGSTSYPARRERFRGFHDVIAFNAGVPWVPARGVNAQAFERASLDSDGREHKVLTIVGRIDGSVIFPELQTSDVWPPTRLANSKVSIDVFDAAPDGPSKLTFQVGSESLGTTRRSLERLYSTHITSKATLDLSANALGAGESKLVWTSKALQGITAEERDYVQIISDWWATLLSRKSNHIRDELKVEGRLGLVASIESKQIELPEIAARALLYVTLAAVSLSILLLIAWRTSRQLATISRRAYAMAVDESDKRSFSEYRGLRNEIGTLARTFDVLLRRSSSRGQKLNRLKQDEVRLAHQQLKVRQALLDAIGHEIRSPLQTLSNSVAPNSALAKPIQRMVRAVEALYEATSIEAGFREGKFLCKTDDMASFLFRLTENLHGEGWPIKYEGPHEGINAFFDSISFETVIDHLLVNARRVRYLETDIVISLAQVDDDVSIEVKNFGPKIPEDQLETIFNLGFSTADDPKSMGLGLFAVRSYIVGMRGTVVARNFSLGVSFVITLPRRALLQ